MKNDNYEHELIEISKKFPASVICLNEEDIIRYFPNQTFIPAHWHRSLEIAYLENIDAILKVGEREYSIKNEFTLINSKEVHSIIGNKIHDKAKSIILLISYDFIKEQFTDYDQINFDIRKLNENKNKFKKMIDELVKYINSSDDYKYMKCNALLFEILYFLFKNCKSDSMLVKIQNKKESVEMLNYVHDNYASSLSLQDAADYFHMSKEHFSRKFHEYLGTTYRDYLCSYRLYKSYDDVIHTNDSIQVISERHGFSNVKSFIQSFSLKYHSTPLKYRKNINK